MTPSRPFLAIPLLTALLACCSCQKQPISAKPPQDATKAAIQPPPSPASPNQSANPPSTPAPQTKFPPRPTGPLGDLGTNFVNTYEARRASVLAQQGPYVVVMGSSLTLHVPGKGFPLHKFSSTRTMP